MPAFDLVGHCSFTRATKAPRHWDLIFWHELQYGAQVYTHIPILIEAWGSPGLSCRLAGSELQLPRISWTSCLEDIVLLMGYAFVWVPAKLPTWSSGKLCLSEPWSSMFQDPWNLSTTTLAFPSIGPPASMRSSSLGSTGDLLEILAGLDGLLTWRVPIYTCVDWIDGKL